MKNPLIPKNRKRRSDSKYRPKFSKDLRDGLRRDGKSVAEVCQIWGISRANYDQWSKSIPIFTEAVEIGNIDCEAFWTKTYRAVACGEQEGNAGLLKQAAMNEFGYTDKSEVKSHHEEEIRIIEIIAMASPVTKIIEHKDAQQLEHNASESTSSFNTESETIRQS